MREGRNIASSNEPLLIEIFGSTKDFADVLPEVGITEVAQVKDDQYNDTDDDDNHTNEDSYYFPGIALGPAAAWGKIAGAPQ